MTTIDEWWMQEAHELCELSNTDRGITMLCGREQPDGSWEYAIVEWTYRSPRVTHQFTRGVMTQVPER